MHQQSVSHKVSAYYLPICLLAQRDSRHSTLPVIYYARYKPVVVCLYVYVGLLLLLQMRYAYNELSACSLNYLPPGFSLGYPEVRSFHRHYLSTYLPQVKVYICKPRCFCHINFTSIILDEIHSWTIWSRRCDCFRYFEMNTWCEMCAIHNFCCKPWYINGNSSVPFDISCIRMLRRFYTYSTFILLSTLLQSTIAEWYGYVYHITGVSLE